MTNSTRETQTIPFTTQGTDPSGKMISSLFYQRTPVEDEMFSAERLSVSGADSLYLIIGWSDSETLVQPILDFDYSAYDSDFLIPAGQTLNFYVETLASASGEMSLNFYPATDKSVGFVLPSGNGQRTLLKSITAENYENFTLSLLASSDYPVSAELEDSTGSVVASFQFNSSNNQYMPDRCIWNGRGTSYAMEPGTSWSFYVVNNTDSINDVKGSFYLQLFETQSDAVTFDLPANTASQVIYTRISPTREFISEVHLNSVTSEPVTLQINNGTQTIEYTFTSSGDIWYPDPEFYLDFGHESTFTLINGTTPAEEVKGECSFYFMEI